MKRIIVTFKLQKTLEIKDREDRRDLCDVIAEDLSLLDLKSRLEGLITAIPAFQDMSRIKSVNVKIED